jgi:pimeloyl-[acyl-carrier protein] methyl ester esterase
MPGAWRFRIFRGFDPQRLMCAGLDTVLLPGLDGTGRLFKPLTDALQPQIRASVVAYPVDAPLGYSELTTYVEGLLPRRRPFSIVAESFSGPVAVRIAAARPEGLVAVVLAGSFVRCPVRYPAWMRPMIGSYLFRSSPPAWLVRRLATGPDAPDDLVAGTLDALRLVKPNVLARRVQELLSVNIAADFLKISVPILYLTGTQDRLLSPAVVRTLQGLRPDLEVAALDAPHFILQRRPAEAAEVIANFLLR